MIDTRSGRRQAPDRRQCRPAHNSLKLSSVF
jgi:hypothetical protein